MSWLGSIRAKVAGMRLGGVLGAIGLLALLARLPLLTASPAAQTPDTPLYASIADRLLYGLDYPGAASLNTIRTPGYPLLLAAVKALPGGWVEAAGVLQILVGVAVAIAVAAAGWRYFDRAVAVLAGVLTALSPLLIATERTLTPDFVFGAVLLGAAVLLGEAVLRDPPSQRLLAGAGAVLGLAAYIKPSAIPLSLAGVLPLAAVTRNLRVTLRGSATLAVAAVLVFAPWIVRNWIVYDYPNMSSVGGVTLFLEVFDHAGLPVPTETAEGRFVDRIRREALDGQLSQLRPTDYTVLAALQRQGRSWQEAADVERDLAITAIRRDPTAYVRSGWSNVRSLFDGVVSLNSSRAQLTETANQDSTQPFRSLGKALWYVGSILGEVWGKLCAGGLFCLLLPFVRDRRKRAAGTALLSVWLLTALVTGYTTWAGVDWRFAAQGAPIILLAGSAAVVLVVRAVLSRLRHPAEAATP